MDCDECELQKSCFSYKIWCEKNKRNPEFYQEWSLEREMYA